MANEILSCPVNPFKYLLIYKFSQDHIELLFSCIHSRGGWNNNPNTLQLKYALQKMLLRNVVTASRNTNCSDFAATSNTILPIFHTRKHSSPLIDMYGKDQRNKFLNDPEVNIMVGHLNQRSQTKFISDVLFYVGGFIVSKLVQQLTCCACRITIIISDFPLTRSDND